MVSMSELELEVKVQKEIISALIADLIERKGATPEILNKLKKHATARLHNEKEKAIAIAMITQGTELLATYHDDE